MRKTRHGPSICIHVLLLLMSVVLTGCASYWESLKPKPEPRRIRYMFATFDPVRLENSVVEFGMTEIEGRGDMKHNWVYPSEDNTQLRVYWISDIRYYLNTLTISFDGSISYEWFNNLQHQHIEKIGRDVWTIMELFAVREADAADALLQFSIHMLSAHEGVVMDDNSEHAWTKDEIISNAEHKGLRFFQDPGKK